jgi:hypothetical protein
VGHGFSKGDRVDRFTLIEQIGRGGMGVVWKASDEASGQIVALKVLHLAYADQPEYVARFERELQLAQRIHSNHVVSVLGFGVRDGIPYLALQYVDGMSLRQHISAHGAYTWAETKPLLLQIASGLADAHAVGVVHRDVKPSNILIGSDGVAKLADFGIAKGIDLTRVTGSSALLGTPTYLAPEGSKDERSDIYSLGVVAYELMAGVPPFEGDTFSDVMLAHIRNAPDLERLPEEGRTLVGWMLTKEAGARPQTVAELIAVLEGKAGAPGLAAALAAPGLAAAAELTRPLPYGGQFANQRDVPRRRRRGGFAVLATAMLMLLAVAVVFGSSSLGGASRSTPTALIAGGAGEPGGSASVGVDSAIPTDGQVVPALDTSASDGSPAATQPTNGSTTTQAPTPTTKPDTVVTVPPVTAAPSAPPPPVTAPSASPPPVIAPPPAAPSGITANATR